MIRVLVAAGSPVVRAGLDAVVRSAAPELDVVGSVPDDAAMVAEGVERLDPDVVLLDAERHGDAGAAPPGVLLALLSPGDAPRASPATVLLVESGDTDLAADALRAGVRAVLSRGAAAAEIVAAVKAVAAGLSVLPPELVESLLISPVRSPSPDTGLSGAGSSPNGATPLTPRETEVLGMLAEGLANKQIAPRLGISEHTVKYHVTSIFAKLGASSRTEAVTIGARRGLVML